ncbi:MAG TPA: TetR/AcrR family transcriptional regulator [Acidimicrobiales bacterium]|jgi:AcrR family transcriptional regulator|nr:TetR/AcrR family transcriptional regulator [Acidimicrobiales bacterium]
MGSPRVQRDAAAPSIASKENATGKKAVGTPTNGSSSEPGPPFSDVDAVGAPASKRVLRSQGRRTMRKLLDAAMIAFDQRGYHATRVNDVVELAKTSHGTFYLYFSNKEDLLRALVTEASTEAQGLYAMRMSPESGGSPQWDDVHGWVRAYSELWLRYAPLFRAWTDLATIDPDLIDVIRQTFTVMSDALAQQIGPDTSGHLMDPEAAGMAVLAMLDRFHYLREFVGRPVDDAAIDTMTTMVYRALFDGTG